MGLLAYCIVSCPASELPSQIEGRKVRLIEVDDLALAVSDVPAAPPRDADAVMAFEAVVEWFLSRCRSLVPVRFGSVLPDDEAAARALRERAPEYQRLLQRLSDTFEIGIRILPVKVPEPPAPPATAQSGAAWLEQRREYFRKRDAAVSHFDAVSAQLRSELAGAFLRTREEAKPEMLSLYFLVARHQADSFLERATGVILPGFRLLVSGPWPPYNFVDGREPESDELGLPQNI